MLTRKAVRRAALSCLSNPQTGFNARLVDIAPDYDFGFSAVDWAVGSGSFFEASIAPEEFELSQEDAKQWPVVNLYTTASSNDRQVMGVIFSGTIQLCVDIWFRVRADLGLDSTIEEAGDAVEDAAISCLYANTTGLHVFGVSPAKNFQCIKDPAQFLGDGWRQRIPIIIPCEVDAS
jgi:hypothetical protein